MQEDFDPRRSLGAMPDEAIGQYLLDIGDVKGAAPYMEGGVSAQALPFPKQAYAATGMSIGFIQNSSSDKHPIVSVSRMDADARLIGRRIKISLDKFYVHSYPGRGTHQILCEFAGKNQIQDELEELRFALRFDVGDRSSASVLGVPIFLGLTVGANGVAFIGKTVNVCSSLDDTILETLDTPAFKNGLSLMAMAQPALKPLVGLASAAVRSIASRPKNKQVHTFNLGLDFGQGVASARLRKGTYVVVQTDDTSWKWDQHFWDANSQNLVNVQGQIPEVNYMAFSVDEYAVKP